MSLLQECRSAMSLERSDTTMRITMISISAGSCLRLMSHDVCPSQAVHEPARTFTAAVDGGGGGMMPLADAEVTATMTSAARSSRSSCKWRRFTATQTAATSSTSGPRIWWPTAARRPGRVAESDRRK